MARDFEPITVTDTAGGLTADKLVGMNHAFVTVETAQIRFRTDGGAATASSGHLIEAGQTIILESSRELDQFSCIRTTGTNAALMVSYDKYSQIGR